MPRPVLSDGGRPIPHLTRRAVPTVAHGSGPKATPLFHEGKLFTVGISGVVSAFDAKSGKTAVADDRAIRATVLQRGRLSRRGATGVVIVHPGNYGPLTAFDSRHRRGEVDGRRRRLFHVAALIVTLWRERRRSCR